MIYRNTQEAIIDEKTFETVQQMRNVKRAYTKFNEPNMFSGLLYCSDCGNRLTIQRVAKTGIWIISPARPTARKERLM